MLELRGMAVRGLEAALGGQQVLKGASLEVAPGEVVALEGASGSGKTTLVRAVAGLVPGRGGEVRHPAGARPAATARAGATASWA